jgi:flagellar basal-body rod protein FlgG
MLDSLSIAASGMSGQQEVIDSISNNLANINTVSYKKNTVNFSNLVYSPVDAQTSGILDVSARKGGGLNVLSVSQDFSLGDVKQTGKNLDLAINGSGFFELTNDRGDKVYSRNGSFKLNSEGALVNGEGLYVSDMIKLPSDVVGINIEKSGEINVLLQGESELIEVGKIELAYFTNPAGLESMGGGNYQDTEQSGSPEYISLNGEETTITQGYLEMSNVSMIEELTSMMLAQQAYGLNSRVVQVSDEIMGMINNLTQG